MTVLTLPKKIPKIEKIMDTIMEVPYVEISDGVLARRLGYYIKPLTEQGLMRFLPDKYDDRGSVVLRKSRSVSKKVGRGHSIVYVFSNEKIKIPKF